MPKASCDTATAWNVDMKFGSGVTLRFEGTPNMPNPGAPCLRRLGPQR